MVTNTLSLVLVSMVRLIWLTRRLTRPASVSMIGHFQFKPGSAMRKNLPKRVTTATCAVFTVKKLPKITESRKNNRMANKVKVTTSMGSLRIVSGDAKLPGRMNADGRDFSARTKARDQGFAFAIGVSRCHRVKRRRDYARDCVAPAYARRDYGCSRRRRLRARQAARSDDGQARRPARRRSSG